MTQIRSVFTGLSLAAFSTVEVMVLGMWAHDVLIGWSRTFPWLH
jgi:hypothetical protein